MTQTPKQNFFLKKSGTEFTTDNRAYYFNSISQLSNKNKNSIINLKINFSVDKVQVLRLFSLMQLTMVRFLII